MRTTLANLALLGLVAASLAGAAEGSDCLRCHGTKQKPATASQRGEAPAEPTALGESIHGDFDCTDCHVGIDAIPHASKLPVVDCGSCHDDAARAYTNHGGRKEAAGHYLPDCHDCHGTHDILPASDPRSRVAPANLLKTCSHCHADPAIVGAYGIPMIAPVEEFSGSVHARAKAGGSEPAATCVDCHSATGTGHQILPPIHPASTIFHFNIPTTCARCHDRIGRDYADNSHGRAAARGESDAPVCTTCHGEHVILSAADRRSPVHPTRVSLTVCGPCHASEMLQRKYGLRAGVMESWKHSYHGMKSTDGDTRVATCASCHLEHSVLPASDPRSSVNPANLHRTCKKCHSGISAAVVDLPIHTNTGIALNRTGQVLQAIYIAAIVVIIGLMIVHWLVELQMHVRLLNRERQIVRIRRDELWQHTLLMVSFLILTLTGFAFHYSGAWWARWLFGWTGGFELRRILHRLASVAFIGTGVWHLIYLCGARGRQFLRDILPRSADFREFGQMIRYNLGRSPERPRFGRFSYIEKAEYWALVWGTAVMTLTGLGLWFGNATEATLGVRALGVMLVVHYWEAVLAGLAILVWHFYSTIFNPPVYPNNPSWYTGSMPARMYLHEHPEDPAARAFEREEAADGPHRQRS